MLPWPALAERLDSGKLPPPATIKVDFQRDIQPIFEASCLRCHSGERPKSGFRLTSRETALRGGSHGVDIVAGQSGKSPLVYYVAGLVEDMEMPPSGRGTPLTPKQIGLLRAWIDQGVAWSGTTNPARTDIAFAPTVGGTTVRGDAQKFRELYWQQEGWNGGLEQFEMTQRPDPDSRISLEGHVLRDDYKVTLTAERNSLGFTRFGWSQFRKYYDDEGGYYAGLAPPAAALNRDLDLDVGRAWADFGLTLPDWPTIVLGYEYQYRDGTEATTQWGPVSQGGETRNIYPGFKQLSERVHILKLDVDYELGGVALNDRFRGEWYHLESTELDENLATNGAPALPFTRVNERQNYFQGANAFHMEKQFTDWLFGAGGYLYSKLDASGSLNMDQVNLEMLDPLSALYAWNSDGIELERESHVFSLSGLVGPWEGLSLSLGTQNEWTRQMGFGTANALLSSTALLPPFFNNFTFPLGLQTDLSDLDHRVFSQTLGLRFTKIPYTTLFAEARFQQEDYGQFQRETGGEFSQIAYNSDAIGHLNDFRAGFNSSSWRRVSLSGQLRRYDNENDYHNLFKEVGNPNQGYPGFIRWRDLLTTEAQGKLALQWTAWLKTSLSYQWEQDHYRTATDPASDSTGAAGGISSGGALLAGKYDAHTASLNATVTPWRRLVLSTTFVFQNARTTTAANGDPSIAPYAGDIYSVLATGNYALNEHTSLVAGYAYSSANFGQDNLTAGLPLGLTYEQHTLQAGLKRQLSKSAALTVQYRFFLYHEPSRGGLDNFQAHGIFATVSCRLP